MTPEEKKSWAKEKLRKKRDELGRPPKKEDFDGATRSRIKAFLGPWHRALEAAGLREAKKADKKEGAKENSSEDAKK